VVTQLIQPHYLVLLTLCCFLPEAAALVLDQGYSHVEACRSLGVVGLGITPPGEKALG